MPTLARTTPRGRPKRGAQRATRRTDTLDRGYVRRRLARELPELPPGLADEADILTLTFLAASLLDPPGGRRDD